MSVTPESAVSAAPLTNVVSRENAYTAATQLYAREHDRWNQWMLFFFGLVAAVFIAWEKVREWLPLWAACFAAGVLAALWVVASTSIRASTWSWFQTLHELETGSADHAFVTYARHLEQYSRLEDFKRTINVLSGHPWRSVTRVVVLIVVLLAVTLFLVGLADVVREMRRAA